MATRCRIAIKVGSVYRSIYVHNNGNPEWTGRMLLLHYANEETIHRLIQMGNASMVNEEFGKKHNFAKRLNDVENPKWARWCLFYGRDRGDTDWQSHFDNNLLQLMQTSADCDADWLYLWFDGKWHYCRVPLESGVVSHLEVLTVWDVFGIERHPQCPLADNVHPLILADWLDEHDREADAALIRTRWQKYEESPTPKQNRTPRKGSLHMLRPVGMDATDSRVTQWSDYIVRVIQPYGCPRNGTLGHCFVETRAGEFIGLVLVASLQPLDRQTRNAIRRERRRLAKK
jgi:hypothetical protein